MKETAKNISSTKSDNEQPPASQQEYKESMPLQASSDNGNSDYWHRKGKKSLKTGKYQEAVADFSKAISLNPYDAEAYGSRALAYMFLYEYIKALKDFDKQIELRPDESRSYSSRGRAYYEMEFFPRAVSDYNKALELNPGDAESWYYRGLSYGSLGDNRQALSDMKAAAKLGNKHAKEFLNSKDIDW